MIGKRPKALTRNFYQMVLRMQEQELNYRAMINVDELWLKGKNRPVYFQTLRRHIVTIGKNYCQGQFKCTQEQQRLIFSSSHPLEDAFYKALSFIPGIHSIIKAQAIECDLEKVFPEVIKQLDELKETSQFPKTFKVVTFRSDKRLATTSMEFSRHLGHLIKKHYQACDLQVDVHTPDVVVEVRLLPAHFYVSCQKIAGVGGFPVGTHGKAVTLISGGIDSPVASYMMMKRGVEQVFMFAHAYPFVGDEVKDKILQVTSHLAKAQRNSFLYVVPFGKAQKAIAEVCPPAYRTLLFRYTMILSAQLIAQKEKAQALVMGDSLGQVSSQTLDNMALLDSSSEYLILRPLVGMNKSEIITWAKKIESFDISLIPQDDACALFSVKHPILRGDKGFWREFIDQHAFSTWAHEAVEMAELYALSAKGEVKKISKTLT